MPEFTRGDGGASSAPFGVGSLRRSDATPFGDLCVLSEHSLLSLSRSYATPSGVVSFLSLHAGRIRFWLALLVDDVNTDGELQCFELEAAAKISDVVKQKISLLSTLCHLAGDRRIFPATAVALRRPRASSVFTNEGMPFPLCFVLVIKLLISVCFLELVLVKIIVRPFS